MKQFLNPISGFLLVLSIGLFLGFQSGGYFHSLVVRNTATVHGAATFNGAVTLGDAAADAITVTGVWTGNSVIRGSDTFSGAAETDTVTISGAGTGDVYIATQVNADTIAALAVEALSGKLVVHRPDSVAEFNAGYRWVRIK